MQTNGKGHHFLWKMVALFGIWWRNREPNPRPHMRFVSKALFLRVPARTKWPFCFVKNLGWVGVGLR